MSEMDMEDKEFKAKILADYSTASLIAELEKRRPNCRTCIRSADDGCCFPCLWSFEFRPDNFKPAK